MIKYFFWTFVGLVFICLCFEQTYRFVLPLSFISLVFYTRFINGSLIELTKYSSDKFNKFTDGLNSCVNMTNEHTKIIKKLTLSQLEVDRIEKRVDKVEKSHK